MALFRCKTERIDVNDQPSAIFHARLAARSVLAATIHRLRESQGGENGRPKNARCTGIWWQRRAILPWKQSPKQFVSS